MTQISITNFAIDGQHNLWRARIFWLLLRIIIALFMPAEKENGVHVLWAGGKIRGCKFSNFYNLDRMFIKESGGKNNATEE